MSISPKEIAQIIDISKRWKIKKIREIIKQNSTNKRIFNNKAMKFQSK